MARKKTPPTAPEPAAPEGKGQISIITLKGTAEFRDWLVGQSKGPHIPAASIVRIGLGLWAEKNGTKAPPGK